MQNVNRRLYLVYPQLKDEVLHYDMSGSEVRHTPSSESQLTDKQHNELTLSPEKVSNKLPYSHLKSIWFSYRVKKKSESLFQKKLDKNSINEAWIQFIYREYRY